MLLPVPHNSTERAKSTRSCSRPLTRRHVVLFVAAVFSLTFLGRVFLIRYGDTYKWSWAADTSVITGLPPLYSKYHHDLLRLPQHNWKEKHPNPKEKFFYVAGYSRGCGWGNAMGELLLNAYIAYKAGRSFVFGSYTWNDNGSLYSEYNGKLIPSLIPYSVILRGPIVGDPFPVGHAAPLAVSREYFEHLCPEKTIIIREAVHDYLSSPNDVKEIVDGWATKLSTVNDPCVQSAINSGQLFNFAVFGDSDATKRVWREFSASPILRNFRWSPLIEHAFDTNRQFFLPPSASDDQSSSPHVLNADRYPPIQGLLAIHVRRGDFEQHCEFLGSASATYTAFNVLPNMVDHFVPRTHGGDGPTSDDRDEHRKHCNPSVEQIIERVREVKEAHVGEPLTRAFIMTNGSPEFINTLKAALQNESSWDYIASSRDMVLNWEQKYVAQAVDMLVGQRAQVFIGNGFSTLTSNVVMMRMANHLPPNNTRLW